MQEKFYARKIRVGSYGYVELIDVMGDECAIVNAARVSTTDAVVHEVGSKEIGLINYLMRHRHTTPFEMVELKFHVMVPMDTWRQWIRHRTASVNEYSTRYRTAIDCVDIPASNEFRAQATDNKQGSAAYFAYETGNEFRQMYKDATSMSASVYNDLIESGVAKEQARRVLPLCTYTEAYWKIDLHNLLHFLELRLHPHAQLEIREYAEAIFEIIAPMFPNVVAAFKEYRLHAYTMSSSEVLALRSVLVGCCNGDASAVVSVIRAIAARHNIPGRVLGEMLRAFQLNEYDRGGADAPV